MLIWTYWEQYLSYWEMKTNCRTIRAVLVTTLTELHGLILARWILKWKLKPKARAPCGTDNTPWTFVGGGECEQFCVYSASVDDEWLAKASIRSRLSRTANSQCRLSAGFLCSLRSLWREIEEEKDHNIGARIGIHDWVVGTHFVFSKVPEQKEWGLIFWQLSLQTLPYSGMWYMAC